MKKTFQPKEKEVSRNWHLIDAKNQVLGRVATQIAILLMGKQKPGFSSHLDSGDYVVVINADKIKVTGRKEKQKLYRRHSGFPGGFKELTYQQLFEKNPLKPLELAVAGMLPDNKLKSDRERRLKLLKGEVNPYQDKFTKDNA